MKFELPIFVRNLAICVLEKLKIFEYGTINLLTKEFLDALSIHDLFNSNIKRSGMPISIQKSIILMISEACNIKNANDSTYSACHKIITSSLLILSQRKMISFSLLFMKFLTKKIEDASGIVRPTVYTYISPTEEIKKEIESFICKIFNSKAAHVDFIEDKSVLGGIKIECNLYVIDRTIGRSFINFTKEMQQLEDL